MEKYLFETWTNNVVKHNRLSFNDMRSIMAFATDFINEHQTWGKWINADNKDANPILYLKTTGNDKGEFYNMKITEI